MGRLPDRMRVRAVASVTAAVVLAAPSVRAQETDVPEAAEGERPSQRERDPSESAAALQAPGRTDGRRRVAVLVLAAPNVDRETADALTEVAIGAVAARGEVSIVGKEEFQTQLGQSEARSMECVTSTACLGRVGVQLDVDEMIAGTVGRRRGTWVFNLNRIDIRSGELVGRTFQDTDGDLGDVAAAIQQGIPQLYELPRKPATLVVSANVPGAEVSIDGILVGIDRGEPVRLDGVPPGVHRVAVRAPGHAAWHRSVELAPDATLQIEAGLEPIAHAGGGVSPLVWAGAGVTVAASMAALYFGISSQSRPQDDVTRAEALAFVDDRSRDARLANISMGIAAAGAVAALVGLLLSGGDAASAPGRARLGAGPLAGGATVQLEGALR